MIFLRYAHIRRLIMLMLVLCLLLSSGNTYAAVQSAETAGPDLSGAGLAAPVPAQRGRAQAQALGQVTIASVAPDPGVGTIGQPLAIHVAGSTSVNQDGTLMVFVGSATATEVFGHIQDTCLPAPGMVSKPFDADLTIPDPGGAPRSIAYTVGAVYVPGTVPCPYRASFPNTDFISKTYSVGWDAPPISSLDFTYFRIPTGNLHSTSAKIEFGTSQYASSYVEVFAGSTQVALFDNRNIQKLDHAFYLWKLLPGTAYTVKATVCASTACLTQEQVFTTIPGCLEIGLMDQGRVIPTFMVENSWGPGELGMQGIAPYRYPIRVRVLVDDASPESTTTAWVTHDRVGQVGDLTYELSLSGFDQGGLQRITLFGDRWRYATSASGQVPTKDDRSSGVYYTPPILMPTNLSPERSAVGWRMLHLNARISRGQGGYDANLSQCPSTTAGLAYNTLDINYAPSPASQGHFNVQASDIKRWKDLLKAERTSQFTDNETLGLLGLIPHPAAIGIGVYQLIQEAVSYYGDLKDFEAWGNSVESFSPREQERVTWVAYSLAGVNPDGTGSVSRSYYMAYIANVVTDPGPPPQIAPHMWQGLISGYPAWLMSSSARPIFNDCFSFAGMHISPSLCMNAESFSPITYTLTNGANAMIGRDANTLGGLYSSRVEPSGSSSEQMMVPTDAYTITTTGLADATFSIMVTRPLGNGWQGVFYKDIPTHIGEQQKFVVPAQGPVPPIVLKDGQPIWPIDYDPPHTSIRALAPQATAGGFYTGTLTIGPQATDDLVGVAETRCRVDRGDAFVFSAPFTVKGAGVHLVECKSTDRVGNAELPQFASFTIDSRPPETRLKLRGTRDRGIYVAPVEIVRDRARDSVSGLGCLSFQLDGAPPQCYTQPLVISSDGQHSLAWHGEDLAGNLEATRTLTFTIQLRQLLLPAPAIALDPAVPTGAGGWYTQPLTASATAANSLPPRCRVDRGGLFTALRPFQLRRAGEYLIRCVAASSDAAAALPSYAAVKLDQSAPRSSIDIEGELDDRQRYKRLAVAYLRADDGADASGIAFLEYQLDGAAWQRYSLPIVVAADGAHRVAYRAVDRAGNVEAERAVSIRVRLPRR